MLNGMKQKLAGRLPGLIMILTGINILLFISSGQYWTLLNPKYMMVTTVTGYAFGLIGLILVLLPATLKRSTLFSALIILGLLSTLNVSIWLNQQGRSPQSSLSLEEHIDRLYSREKLMDKEYIKINIAELTTLIENKSSQIGADNFLFRGQIYRSGTDEYQVLRTVVSCCLADAITIGLRIRTNFPIDYADGQWIKVYGCITEDTKREPSDHHFAKTTGFMTVIQPGVVFQADVLKNVDPPDFPLIFQFRQEEPFAY